MIYRYGKKVTQGKLTSAGHDDEKNITVKDMKTRHRSLSKKSQEEKYYLKNYKTMEL